MAKSGYGKKVSTPSIGESDPRSLYAPGQSALRRPRLTMPKMPKAGALKMPLGIKRVAMQGGLTPHVGFQAVAKALGKKKK
jgi:hypothetical protein